MRRRLVAVKSLMVTMWRTWVGERGKGGDRGEKGERGEG